MRDQHLTIDDMALFTRLRMTAFGEAVIDIANDPAFDPPHEHNAVPKAWPWSRGSICTNATFSPHEGCPGGGPGGPAPDPAIDGQAL